MGKLSRGTTAQRPTYGLYAGLEYFNTDINDTEYYNGSVWVRNVHFGRIMSGGLHNIADNASGVYNFYTEDSSIVLPDAADKGYANTILLVKSTLTSGRALQFFISGRSGVVYSRSVPVGSTDASSVGWNVLYNPKAQSGTSSNRPSVSNTSPIHVGCQYFDTTVGKPIFWNGSAWVETDGESAGIRRSGTFGQKPTPTNAGFQYFCTSGASIDGGTTEKTNIVIYYTGSGWVDANGNAVVAKA